MKKKMVIKNCPSLEYGEICRSICVGEYDCQDCTDCLLKQIVKITKNYNKGCDKHCDINRKENNCGKTCNAYKIRQILELLNIQEMEINENK
jgi:hypothetical protein